MAVPDTEATDPINPARAAAFGAEGTHVAVHRAHDREDAARRRDRIAGRGWIVQADPVVTGRHGLGHLPARRRGGCATVDPNVNATGGTALALREARAKTRTFASDLTVPEGCRAILDGVPAWEGWVDVLRDDTILNPLWDTPCGHREPLTPVLAVNLHVIHHLCRAAMPSMTVQGGGTSVHTVCRWGLHAAPDHVADNVTRAARELHSELRPRRRTQTICVNPAPGRDPHAFADGRRPALGAHHVRP